MRKKIIKRKTIKKISKLKNKIRNRNNPPIHLSDGNLRRWAYLNFPKYKSSDKFGIDLKSAINDALRQLIIPVSRYGEKVAIEQARKFIRVRLVLFAVIWVKIHENPKLSNEQKMKLWEEKMIRDPPPNIDIYPKNTGFHRRTVFLDFEE